MCELVSILPEQHDYFVFVYTGKDAQERLMLSNYLSMNGFLITDSPANGAFLGMTMMFSILKRDYLAIKDYNVFIANAVNKDIVADLTSFRKYRDDEFPVRLVKIPQNPKDLKLWLSHRERMTHLRMCIDFSGSLKDFHHMEESLCSWNHNNNVVVTDTDHFGLYISAPMFAWQKYLKDCEDSKSPVKMLIEEYYYRIVSRPTMPIDISTIGSQDHSYNKQS